MPPVNEPRDKITFTGFKDFTLSATAELLWKFDFWKMAYERGFDIIWFWRYFVDTRFKYMGYPRDKNDIAPPPLNIVVSYLERLHT